MRKLEYVENELKRETEYLSKIDSLRLGFLLKGIYYRDSNVKSHVENSLFRITFHCHDTGVSTDSYIIRQDCSLYKIAHRTYWYNESQYGFNKWWYDNGAWDEKYEEFIQELRNRLVTLVNNKITQLNGEILKIKTYLKEEKSDVENMFL